eukprot:8422661-Pyramimonas_sp.AAC.2
MCPPTFLLPRHATLCDVVSCKYLHNRQPERLTSCLGVPSSLHDRSALLCAAAGQERGGPGYFLAREGRRPQLRRIPDGGFRIRVANLDLKTPNACKSSNQFGCSPSLDPPPSPLLTLI